MSLSAGSDVIPIDPAIVPSWVSQVTVSQYFKVVVATIAVYDAIITMDTEVKYFWKAPFTTVNFVYFSSRYFGIFSAVIRLLCTFAVWAQNISSFIAMICIDYILMIRVLALYGKARLLTVFIASLLALESAYSLGASIYMTITEEIAVGGLAADVTVCVVAVLVPWQLGAFGWLMQIVYGLVLMAFALYKAAGYWRMSAGLKGFNLVKVLVRDQCIYFILAVSCAAINMLQYRTVESSALFNAVLAAVGSPSLLTILGSRMLVNLKEAGELGLNQGTNYRVTSRSVSEMDFAEPVDCQSEHGREGV